MNLLLAGAYSYTDQQIQELIDMGYTIDYLQKESDELQCPEKYQVVVCNNLFKENSIDKFKKLRVIQLTSTGIDRVPLDEIKSRGIKLYNAGTTYSAPIAEFAIMRLLEIYKKSMLYYERQTEGIWKKDKDLFELEEKSIGILGYGNIGAAIARRLRPFGVEIVAINRSNIDSEDIDKYVPLDSFGEILVNIDVLIVCISLTNETKNMIDEHMLGLMKDNAVIINISRGGIIDENALMKSMNSGKFMGCALDVFSSEPPEWGGGKSLWNTPRVLVSPHIAYASDRIKERLFATIRRNLLEVSIDETIQRENDKEVPLGDN